MLIKPIVFAENLVTMMAQNPNLISETVTYIRLELLGLLVSVLVKFMMVVLILKEF